MTPAEATWLLRQGRLTGTPLHTMRAGANARRESPTPALAPATIAVGGAAVSFGALALAGLGALGVGVTVGEGDSVGDGDAELLDGDGDELDGEGDGVGTPPTNC